jgi:hypothetical protein
VCKDIDYITKVYIKQVISALKESQRPRGHYQ